MYLELNNSRDNANYKQLTVASVTQGIYHLPKSEVVCNLLNWDDDVEVEIVKAKPKYPRNIGEVKV